jgi:hypothetical protein
MSTHPISSPEAIAVIWLGAVVMFAPVIRDMVMRARDRNDYAGSNALGSALLAVGMGLPPHAYWPFCVLFGVLAIIYGRRWWKDRKDDGGGSGPVPS